MILGKGLVLCQALPDSVAFVFCPPLPVAWAALSRPSRSSSSPGLHFYVLHYSASLSKQEPDSISRQSRTESVSIQERSTKKETPRPGREVLQLRRSAFVREQRAAIADLRDV